MQDIAQTIEPAPETLPRTHGGYFYVIASDHVERYGDGPYPFQKFNTAERAKKVATKMAERAGKPFYVAEFVAPRLYASPFLDELRSAGCLVDCTAEEVRS